MEEEVLPEGEVQQEEAPQHDDIPQQQEVPVNTEQEKSAKEQPEQEKSQKELVDVPSSSSCKRKLTFATKTEAKKGKVSETMVDISKMSTRQLKELTKRKQDMALSSVRNILYNFVPDADIDEPVIDQLKILAVSNWRRCH